MRRRSRFQPAPEPRRELTPMIDVVFLLIVFFTVAMEFNSLAFEQIDLPVADQVDTDVSAPSGGCQLLRYVNLNLLADGTIRIRERTFSLRAEDPGMWLEDYLRTEVAGFRLDSDGYSDLCVVVRADRHADFGHVQRVFEACSARGIYQTSLAATPGGME